MCVGLLFVWGFVVVVVVVVIALLWVFYVSLF